MEKQKAIEVAFHLLKGDKIMDNTHRIIPVNGHYEAYNSFGEFVTSGDTYKECENDLIEMLLEDLRMGNIREKVGA